MNDDWCNEKGENCLSRFVIIIHKAGLKITAPENGGETTGTKERTEPVTFKSPEKQLKLPIFLKSFSSRVLLNPWRQEFWVNRRGWLTNRSRDGKITLSNNYWSKKDRTTSKDFGLGCGRRLELFEIRSSCR